MSRDWDAIRKQAGAQNTIPTPLFVELLDERDALAKEVHEVRNEAHRYLCQRDVLRHTVEQLVRGQRRRDEIERNRG